MQKIHNVLLGVSILPALLVMPAAAVDVSTWDELRSNVYSGTVNLVGNITPSAGESIRLNGDPNAGYIYPLVVNGNGAFYIGGATPDAMAEATSIFELVNGGSATLNNILVQNTAASGYGALTISGAGLGFPASVLTLGGVNQIAHNTGSQGAGLYNSGTVVSAVGSDVQFSYNTASGTNYVFGGALRNDGGNITFNGTVEFDHNTNTSTALDRSMGGALYTSGAGEITFNDQVAFTYNSAGVGSAIYINGGSGQVTFNDDALFSHNSSTTQGTIYNGGGELTFNNVTFSENSSTNGSAAVNNSGTMTILGNALFSNNNIGVDDLATAAVYNDGQLYIKNTQNRINSIEFSGNESNNSGAALNNNLPTLGSSSPGIVELDATTITFSGNKNSRYYGGAIYNAGNMEIIGDTIEFSDNKANSGQIGTSALNNFGGGAIQNKGSLVIGNADSVTTFSDNTSAVHGGAILNRGSSAEVTLNGTKSFEHNGATLYGGAIYNAATVNLGDNVSFTDNSAASGGAIFNAADATLTIGNNAVFTDNTAAYKPDGTPADTPYGGSDIKNYGSVTIGNNARFTRTTYRDAINDDDVYDTGIYTMNGSTTSVGDNAFFNNIAQVFNNEANTTHTIGNNAMFDYNGSVITNFGGTYTIGNDATFKNSQFMTLANKGNGSSITVGTGALFENNSNPLFTFEDASTYMYMEGNGAVANNDSTNSVMTFGDGLVVRDNLSAGNGVMYNKTATSTLNFNGSAEFSDNTAEYGAIYNKSGTVNFAGSATFSDSKNNAGEAVSDIYNTGTVNITAAENTELDFVLGGGIDGATASVATNRVNFDGAGTVNLTGNINNQTINVSNGALHLASGAADGSNLVGSMLTVASGATINTIDDLINDYTSKIALNTGAIIAGDVDYLNGVADTYSAAAGATAVTYKLANALNVSNGDDKYIQVVDGAVTVNADENFAWFNSDAGMTLMTSGNADGKVKVTGLVGGINAAVDYTNENNQEVAYNLTATETFNGADNTIENASFTITGNGNTATSNQLVLASDLVVDGVSTLNLNDVVLAQTAGTETIHNNEGGNLVITDSRISVNINNAGTLNSDPTYYDAQVVNSGTANFDGDIFESTSSLTNNGGTVNLTAVEFKAGSVVSGDGMGTINVKDGQTTFNSVVSNNNLTMTNAATVVVGESGSIDGLALATAGGNVTLANGKIDNLGAVTASGNVSMSIDANLATGAIDNVAGLTGSGALVIDNITLATSAYADSGASVTMDVANGGNVALADDFTVTGGNNYFTKVAAADGNVVFGDKLMNTSGMHSQLGDWADGNHISASSTYDTTTDAYTAQGQTVGQALTALDTALGHASSAGVAATGLVADVEANAAAINDLNNTVTGHTGAISSLNSTVSGHTSAIDSLNTAVDGHTSAINSLNSTVDSHTAAIDTLNGDADVVGSVDNKIALNLTNANNFAMQRDALTLGAANAYTDKRVEKLDKNLSAGVAGAVALSSVAVSNVRRGEVSVGAGYGYFNGQSAGAFGAAMGLSNRWSVNAGAGVSGYDVSFRAGTNYKFKLF